MSNWNWKWKKRALHLHNNIKPKLNTKHLAKYAPKTPTGGTTKPPTQSARSQSNIFRCKEQQFVGEVKSPNTWRCNDANIFKSINIHHYPWLCNNVSYTLYLKRRQQACQPAWKSRLWLVYQPGALSSSFNSHLSQAQLSQLTNYSIYTYICICMFDVVFT